METKQIMERYKIELVGEQLRVEPKPSSEDLDFLKENKQEIIHILKEKKQEIKKKMEEFKTEYRKVDKILDADGDKIKIEIWEHSTIDVWGEIHWYEGFGLVEIDGRIFQDSEVQSGLDMQEKTHLTKEDFQNIIKQKYDIESMKQKEKKSTEKMKQLIDIEMSDGASFEQSCENWGL